MNHAIYTKAGVNPIELAARLKPAILLLEPVMQACEPHSKESDHLCNLLHALQGELDDALKAALHEVNEQQIAGLITFEQYAHQLTRVMAHFTSFYIRDSARDN